MGAERVAMGISFFPRGGSAQVVRYLAGALEAVGWHARVFTGSLGGPDALTNAERFYGGLELATVDFSVAWRAAETGGDAMRAAVPLHPSFEDREGAPDRIFTSLDDEDAERQIDLWTRTFRDGDARGCRLFHLHHLSAQHAGAARACPELPIVAHLHGTDLKMVDGIRVRRSLLERLGSSFEAASRDPEAVRTTANATGEWTEDERLVLDATRWPSWRHADAWDARLGDWARGAAHLICISDHDRDESIRLLDVPAERISVVRNGVDTSLFDDRHLSPVERHEHWRRWLVDEPLGWDESGRPGSRRCRPEEFARFFPDPRLATPPGPAPPVLLFIGRFLGFKRVPLLIRAYARARAAHPDLTAPLVLWGGNPGEWEGEHPAAVMDELGIDGVFFVGWRGHDELPTGINCADVMAAPSFNEPFGQVYLEAMACAVPVIGTTTGGPTSFVNTTLTAPNGWMVAPDDEPALADALHEAATDADERARRGTNAYEQIRGRYAWSAIAGQFADVYERVLQRAARPAAPT